MAAGGLMQMPPEKKRTKEKKYSYDQNYLRQNMVAVNITFNRQKPDDMVILDWLNSRKESKVAYMKRLIISDMEKAGE